MKKLLAIWMIFLLLPIVNAQQKDDPGITPDSFLWIFDKAFEKLDLFLTTDKGKVVIFRCLKCFKQFNKSLKEAKEKYPECKKYFGDKAMEEN